MPLRYRPYRPPYYREPIDRCDICKESLIGRLRYRVKVFIKGAEEPAKVFHLCEPCLRRLLRRVRADRRYRRLRIKYRKMPLLGWP